MGTVAKIKDVDFNKLSGKLKERGLNMRKASLLMGKSDAYLGGMKKTGHLTESTLILLDAMWNIKYEEVEPTIVEEPIAVEEVEPSAVENKAETVAITKEELRYIITEAIKDAFNWYANL